jgi:hypothetical protein
MLTGIAVMALVVQIIGAAVKETPSLVLLGLTITTDGTTTVVEIRSLFLKKAEFVANLVQVFNIGKKAHRKGSN